MEELEELLLILPRGFEKHIVHIVKREKKYIYSKGDRNMGKVPPDGRSGIWWFPRHVSGTLEEVRFMDYPTAEEVGEFAKQIVIEVMAPRKGSNTGSDKSGPGEWYTKDWVEDPYYHVIRIMGHCVSAQRLGPSEADSQGETGLDHAKRCVVRAAFLAFTQKYPIGTFKKPDWRTYGQEEALKST